ncbi:MAG: histidine--tRNA ligase [Candidatus Moranbacteria bacterium]|nr:histidine--tRNA ligase [Candidatus Moranbacteria bacterium]
MPEKKSQPKKKEELESEKSEKKALFSSVRGMRDLLPENQPYWNKIRKMVDKVAYDYNYHRIDTPLVEYRELFERTTGSDTDIVEKEMYKFKTQGGDDVSLRPEGTPSVVRAYIQHGMRTRVKPVKLYYIGSMYRHDRPQKGRYREFYQFGFEALGEKDPILDAQIIQLSLRLLNAIGIRRCSLQLNSIGCRECRPNYNELLITYLKNRKQSLCMDCKKRLRSNPLRILDCKEEKCVQVLAQAPQSIDHLCKECKNHFTYLLECLDEIKVSYEINPKLVRGLDYYTKTVFEIWPEGDEEGKGSLGGGGRYDYLVEKLGGKKTPAVGFAAGMDRIAEEMKDKDVRGYEQPKPKVFLAQLGDMAKMKSLRIFQDLEKAGITVAESFGKGNLRAQLKRADRRGVNIVLIIGQREALDETVIIKDMKSGSQEVIDFKKVVDDVKKKLDKIKKESI